MKRISRIVKNLFHKTKSFLQKGITKIGEVTVAVSLLRETRPMKIEPIQKPELPAIVRENKNFKAQLTESDIILKTGSGDILVFSKNVDKKAEFETRKACFEQQMPTTTNELEFLEGSGTVILASNHGVDDFSVPPNFSDRSSKSVEIPKSGNAPKIPQEFPRPHKSVEKQDIVGGATGAGGSGSDSGGPSIFDTEILDQCHINRDQAIAQAQAKVPKKTENKKKERKTNKKGNDCKKNQGLHS